MSITAIQGTSYLIFDCTYLMKTQSTSYKHLKPLIKNILIKDRKGPPAFNADDHFPIFVYADKLRFQRMYQYVCHPDI